MYMHAHIMKNIAVIVLHYSLLNQVQAIVRLHTRDLLFRGGEIFIDNLETQCHIDHDDEAVKGKENLALGGQGRSDDNSRRSESIDAVRLCDEIDGDVPEACNNNLLNANQHVGTDDCWTSAIQEGNEERRLDQHETPVRAIRFDDKNLAFIAKSESNRKTQRFDRCIAQKLRDQFSSATTSLQNIVKTRKPVLLHFTEDLKNKYGKSASKFSEMKKASLNKIQELKAIDLARTKDVVAEIGARAKLLTTHSSTEALRTTILNLTLSRESTLLLWNLSFSLLGASIGFISFLYFVSVGYGLAIGTLALAIIIWGDYMGKKQVPPLTYLHTGLVILWAMRLMLFLLHREFVTWPEWHEKVCEVDQRTDKRMKSSVWITCSFFYAMMMYPCANRMRNAIDNGRHAVRWGAVGRTGIIFQLMGLTLETIADNQKGEFKRKAGNRDKWCNVGLWSKFSHPNYLGEAIFWCGVFLGGLACNKTAKDWLISITGLIFILTVIKGAMDSLESKHARHYGQNPDFIAFRKERGLKLKKNQ